ncbi:MAG: phosphate ABC transporter substrate-binding protein [Verrucomicrobia bacterium]|nr:phosphate ABC transporter substrate-binding protein [Verrucomicrobiota bacterium]
MKTDKMNLRWKLAIGACLVAGLCLVITGCGRKGDGTSSTGGKNTIQNTGSDTMVNIAQAWAEAYDEVKPSVSIEVAGGGSGTGVAAMINGTVDIANCSREMTQEEIDQAEKNTGKTPKKHIVAYDGVAIFVHKNNPMNEITFKQLAEIYGESGKIDNWSQLDVQLPSGASDEIVRVGRQNSSGTFYYFREEVLGERRDFKLGSRDLNGSKEVVELISRTPGAIGYSGMGYDTEEVKMLHVAEAEGEEATEPTVENVISGHYPLSRPLYMYSLGEPTGEVKAYLDWVHTPKAQLIVRECGYVPMPSITNVTEETPDLSTSSTNSAQ